MTPTTFFTSLMIAWVVVYIAIPAGMLMRGWIVSGGLVQLIGAFLPGIWHGAFWPDEAGNFGLLMMMLVPIPLCIIVIGLIDRLVCFGGWAFGVPKTADSSVSGPPTPVPTASTDILS